MRNVPASSWKVPLRVMVEASKEPVVLIRRVAPVATSQLPPEMELFPPPDWLPITRVPPVTAPFPLQVSSAVRTMVPAPAFWKSAEPESAPFTVSTPDAWLTFTVPPCPETMSKPRLVSPVPDPL